MSLRIRIKFKQLEILLQLQIGVIELSFVDVHFGQSIACSKRVDAGTFNALEERRSRFLVFLLFLIRCSKGEPALASAFG